MTDLTHLPLAQTGITDPDRPEGFQDDDPLPDPLVQGGTSRAIVNPPGQARLNYRVGDYTSFLQAMLLRLHSQTVSWTDMADAPQTARPLRHLNITRHPNWIVALLQAWAVVGDIFTFYQEQIANEGYLATATENLSVRELLRTIGYELHPGVAASTYLAFTLLDATAAPDRVVIPAGTAVQSLPPSVTGLVTPDRQSPPTRDQLPVTFETIAPIEARVAWNTLPAYLPTRHPAIRRDSTQLLLRGVKTGIRPGDGLLLLLTGDGSTPAAVCRVVQRVIPNPASGWTQLTWQIATPDPTPAAATPNPQVLTFRKQTALFGKDIPKWDTLTDAMKQKYGGSPAGGVLASTDSGQTWQSVHQAFVGKAVRTLAATPRGLFAATDAGVLRSLDHGQTWSVVNTGLTRKDVYALTPTDSGDLLAGSADGAVFRLRSGSDRWELVRSTLQTATASPTTQATALPTVSLYALATGRDPKTQQTVYFIGTDRGVLRSLDDGMTWTAVGPGLPGWNKTNATIAVYTLVVQSATGLVMLGSDRGIFISKNWGDTWKAANRGLSTAPLPTPSTVDAELAQAQAVLEQAQTDLQVASDRIQAASTRVRPVLDRLRQVTQTVGTVIPSPVLSLVGTVTGLASGLADQTKSLLPVLTLPAPPATPGLPTHTLLLLDATSQRPTLLAGTDQGLFRSLDGGQTWISLSAPANPPNPLAGVVVQSLLLRPTGSGQTELLAGTEQGLYRSLDQGLTWTPVSSLTTAVSALATSGDGQLLALTPFLGLHEPPEQRYITADQIDLNQVYPGIACDSWIMLEQSVTTDTTTDAMTDNPPTPSKLAACRVTQVTTATRQIRSRTLTVTRLRIDPNQTDVALLQTFDPRQTIVRVQSEAIALFETPINLPVWGQTLRLMGTDLDLKPGQTISLVGKHPTIRLITERALTLTSLDGLQSVTLQPQKLFDLDQSLTPWLEQGGVAPNLQSRFQDNQITFSPQVSLQPLATADRWLLLDVTPAGDYRGYLILVGERQLSVYDTIALQVITPKQPVSGDAHQRHWHIMTATGFEGTVALTPGDYRWEPAMHTSAAIREMVRVQDSKPSTTRHYTLVWASQPLQYLYDPGTVSLCGNVAPATHGETVRKEVVGTGDASQANQQFVLKKPPLTYVPAPTPDGSQSTLEVRVRSGMVWGPVQTIGALDSRRQEDGVLWTQVSTLAHSTPQDHHYTVRVNHDGKTTIVFGDGKQGARLPSGLENVEATYRSGSGTAGNLEPDRLVLPKNRPPGIRKVTNPLPASGGTDPESLESAKRHAPGALRALQRIISLTDYEDFATSFAGVGKAQVQRLWNGRVHLIHLTIAAADGSSADPVALLQPLRTAIGQYQAATQPVQIDSFIPCFFNLSATVLIQPDRTAADIQAAIVQSLMWTFSFANRQFGQAVAASEVITAIQMVPGVVAVDLLALYRYGTPPQPNIRLDTVSAHWDQTQAAIVPAELLLLNTRSGLNLSIAPT